MKNQEKEVPSQIIRDNWKLNQERTNEHSEITQDEIDHREFGMPKF